MLTKLSTTVSSVALVSAIALPLLPSPASADPCPGAGSGGGGIDVCAGTGVENPNGSGGGGGGDGGNSGGTDDGPGLGCGDNGGIQIECPVTEDPAPIPNIPTIDVANQARDRLALPSPTINFAPSPRTYVQLKTSLWIDQADFGTFSIAAEVPGQTVTATATPQRVTWDLVEKSITCEGPGSPQGTDCGYTYQRSSAGQPTGAYRISATTTWNIAWTCTGVQCDSAGGTLPAISNTSSVPLQVGEIQTGSQPG